MTSSQSGTTPTGVLPSLLSAGADEDPALISPERGQVFSYGQLRSAVGTVARKLRIVGVDAGDRVAFVAPHGMEFAKQILAIVSIGAAAAPLNPRYKRNEYAFFLGDLEPHVLLLPEGDLDAARAAAGSSVPIVDVLESDEDAPALVADGHRVDDDVSFDPPEPDDIALLLHTSGTWSRPKQVPLLHRNVMAVAHVVANHYGLSRGDVSYCAMPLFHGHGLVGSLLSPLVAGGAVVLPRSFKPENFWPQARAHGVTWFSAAPTLHHMILEEIDPEGAPPTLRFVRSCSSALSPALMERAEQAFGVPMLEAYGMTEASHQIASNAPPPGPRSPGTVGVPTGTEIRILDERGKEVSPDTPGEVVIRGPGVTPGYLKNAQANSEAFVNGWFRTGDLGVLTDGYLRLEGRLKEIIVRGGENISPQEVENILLSHEAVADAVCFGTENEKYGEEVEAAVVLNGTVEARELQEHCRKQLATFKVPKVIHTVEALPRTATGKLQRWRVRKVVEDSSS